MNVRYLILKGVGGVREGEPYFEISVNLILSTLLCKANSRDSARNKASYWVENVLLIPVDCHMTIISGQQHALLWAHQL